MSTNKWEERGRRVRYNAPTLAVCLFVTFLLLGAGPLFPYYRELKAFTMDWPIPYSGSFALFVGPPRRSRSRSIELIGHDGSKSCEYRPWEILASINWEPRDNLAAKIQSYFEMDETQTALSPRQIKIGKRILRLLNFRCQLKPKDSRLTIRIRNHGSNEIQEFEVR